MSSSTSSLAPDASAPIPSHEVLQQAAEWFAALDAGEVTEADRRNWEAWLAQSREHREAWRYVERISERFAPIHTSPQRQSAVTAYQMATGILARRRQTLLGLVALAGSSLLGWGAWHHTGLPELAAAWSADHSAGAGEIRDVRLPDGTHVWLNAQSAFNQDYRPAWRRLQLVRGEIHIDTATDPQQRPFYVETPHGRMQALGTRFTVRLDDKGTLLAVYHGAVDVHTHDTGASVVVPAGKQVRFTSTALSATTAADPAREAWTRGLLVAYHIPLASVVQELRRYHRGHLSLSPEAAGLSVLGGYPVNDPDQTLTMLESVLPIRVRRTLPWWVSIDARPESDTDR
jgi:transmembrane sensor